MGNVLLYIGLARCRRLLKYARNFFTYYTTRAAVFLGHVRRKTTIIISSSSSFFYVSVQNQCVWWREICTYLLIFPSISFCISIWHFKRKHTFCDRCRTNKFLWIYLMEMYILCEMWAVKLKTTDYSSNFNKLFVEIQCRYNHNT